MDTESSILNHTMALAIYGTFSGMAGKLALSCFNPSMAIAVGGFGKVAAIGALAAPLCIPLGFLSALTFDMLFSMDLYNLAFTPYLICGAAVMCSAYLLGAPILPSLVCVMVLPTLIVAFELLKNLFTDCAPENSNSYGFL